MENLTRRKVIATATTIALVTLAVVMITKFIGAIAVAAFFAGVGVTLVIGLGILASILADPSKPKK